MATPLTLQERQLQKQQQMQRETARRQYRPTDHALEQQHQVGHDIPLRDQQQRSQNQ